MRSGRATSDTARRVSLLTRVLFQFFVSISRFSSYRNSSRLITQISSKRRLCICGHISLPNEKQFRSPWKGTLHVIERRICTWPNARWFYSVYCTAVCLFSRVLAAVGARRMQSRQELRLSDERVFSPTNRDDGCHAPVWILFVLERVVAITVSSSARNTCCSDGSSFTDNWWNSKFFCVGERRCRIVAVP